MLRPIVLTFALLLATPATAQEVNLRCTVQGQDYNFAFDQQDNTLHQITPNGAYPFQAVTADRFSILAKAPARPFFGEEDGMFSVNLQRVTGEVSLTWTLPVTADDERQCRASAAAKEAGGAWWCSDPVVRRSATGRCQRIERLF
jgi:hypothetical protein